MNPRALLVTCDSCRFGWVPNPPVEHVHTRGCVSKQSYAPTPPRLATIFGCSSDWRDARSSRCWLHHGMPRESEDVRLRRPFGGRWRFRVGGRRSLATRRDRELASVTESVDDGFFQLNSAPDSAAQTSTEPPAMSVRWPTFAVAAVQSNPGTHGRDVDHVCGTFRTTAADSSGRL